MGAVEGKSLGYKVHQTIYPRKSFVQIEASRLVVTQ
jgi:hypothetical protein